MDDELRDTILGISKEEALKNKTTPSEKQTIQTNTLEQQQQPQQNNPPMMFGIPQPVDLPLDQFKEQKVFMTTTQTGQVKKRIQPKIISTFKVDDS